MGQIGDAQIVVLGSLFCVSNQKPSSPHTTACPKDPTSVCHVRRRPWPTVAIQRSNLGTCNQTQAQRKRQYPNIKVPK